MSNDQIIRAWKDENYRSSLSEAQRAQLPPHPAGLIELSDFELNDLSGGVSNGGTLWCSASFLCGGLFSAVIHCLE